MTPVIPLARETADAEARTVGANLSFTTRPWRRVAIDARYRPYTAHTGWVRMIYGW